MHAKFPVYDSPVFHTERMGTPYLKSPGVVMLSQPLVSLATMDGFLSGFDESLGFTDYNKDPRDDIDAATLLCKTAGQLCYMSLGPKRTKNDQAEKYFDNIKSSGHGSVLEHANFTFLFYGIDRSVTHELVRHRAGFGFSQVSQRYVDGKVLRFVERPEFSSDPVMHYRFEKFIDSMAVEYHSRAEHLKYQNDKDPVFNALSSTDKRKRVNQAARSSLPNETEAPIVVTANARAWRHFAEMRCNKHADLQIRLLAGRTLSCLQSASPVIFGDYKIGESEDGLPFAETSYRKV